MKFHDQYFKLKDMELNNVNDINSTNAGLTPIEDKDMGIARREEPDEISYTYDPEKGYVPNRPPKIGEVGYSPTSRFGVGQTPE